MKNKKAFAWFLDKPIYEPDWKTKFMFFFVPSEKIETEGGVIKLKRFGGTIYITDFIIKENYGKTR
jgi:hypothetical protein